jgi:cell division protein FtsQ
LFRSKRNQKPPASLSKARHVGPRLKRQKVARRPAGEKKPSAWAKGFLKVVGFTATVAGLVLLVTAVLLGGYGLLASHPRFKVKKAEVQGTRYLTRFQILRAAGIGSHSSLWALPVGKIENRLNQLTWVRRAKVIRSFPNTVRIQIQEHQARQMALLEGRLYFLDAEEGVFAPLLLGPPPDLPVVSGLSRADLKDPDEESSALLQAAVHVLGLLSQRGDHSLSHLSEVHLSRVWGISLVWDDISATVRLGFGKYEQNLERLDRVLADLKRRGELDRTTLIDLNAGPRIVVRLSQEPA